MALRKRVTVKDIKDGVAEAGSSFGAVVFSKKDEMGSSLFDIMFLGDDYGTAIESMANLDIT